MTQTIDRIKLKAAAEHLEWALEQHPKSEDVQALLHGLLPLIERAKENKITGTIGRRDIPFAYAMTDGRYRTYTSPDIETAYYEFSAEMRGGRDAIEIKLIADVEAIRKARDDKGGRP